MIDSEIRDELYGAMRSILGPLMDRILSYKQKARIISFHLECHSGVDAWPSVRDDSVNECWKIFLEQPMATNYIIEESISEIGQGNRTFADMARRVCEKIIMLFVQAVEQSQKDDDYEDLRQMMTKMRDSSGEPVFHIKRHERYKKINTGKRGMGTLFSPVDVPGDSPEFAREDMESPLATLGAPDRSIRKPRMVVAGDAKYVKPCWHGPHVKSQATRFWEAFVAERNGGVPCYTPLYAMYCWLKRYFCLGRYRLESLDDPVGNAAGDEFLKKDVISFNDGQDPEEDLQAAEVRALAAEFAAGLSYNEAVVCSALFDEDGTMKKVAEFLGLAGPSSVTRHKNALLKSFRTFFSLNGEWSGDDLYRAIFAHRAREECKKRVGTSGSNTRLIQ